MLNKEESNAAGNIERLMQERDLSIRDLAKMANVNYGTLHAFIARGHSPRLGFVCSLARALEVGIETLLQPVKTGRPERRQAV